MSTLCYPALVQVRLHQKLWRRIVVVQQSSAPGLATVATPNPVDDLDSFLVAAGVAVIQYAWAWEESPAVVVTVNGIAFTITARHREGKTYIAKQVDAA